MYIPRIDTLIIKNNAVKNGRQMRIPTDLNKPVFVKSVPVCNQKTTLNIVI